MATRGRPAVGCPTPDTTATQTGRGHPAWQIGAVGAPVDLVPIIEALESLVLVSAITRFPHDFDPAPGSPAESEFAKQSGFAGSWSAAPLADVTSMGNMQIYAAEDNLRSAGSLIAGGNSRYGPLTLARSAFEVAAQAWWIYDPDIALDERLCRGGNFILHSHYERRKLEREMGAAETRTPKIDAILDTARQAGLSVIASRKGSPAWLGGGLKDATSLCRLFMQDQEDPNSTIGAVIYRALSATPHGTLHGLLRNAQPVEGAPSGQTGTWVTPGVDPGEVAMFVAGVLVAYVIAADRQMAYFGWGGPAWDNWKLALKERGDPYLGRASL